MIKFKFVPFCVFFVKQSLSRLCSGAICAFFFFFVFFLFTFFLFAVSVPAALAEGDVSVSALSWQCASDPDSGSFVSPVFRDFSREIGIAVSEDFSGMRETFTESDDFSGTGDVFGMQDRLEAGGTSVCFVPTLTDNLGMTYPREEEFGIVSVSADSYTTRREGQYTVYVLEGKCELRQGQDSFCSERMVLWVSPLQLDAAQRSVYQVLLYLEGTANVSFVTAKTTSKVEADMWAGRLNTQTELQIRAEFVPKGEGTSGTAGPADGDFYTRAFQEMFRPARLLLTQYAASAAEAGLQGTEAGSVQAHSSPSSSPSSTPTSTPSSTPTSTLTSTPTSTPSSVLESSPELPLQKTEGEVVVSNTPLHTEEDAAMPPLVFSTEGRIRSGNISSFDPNAILPGSRRISFFPRGDEDMQINVTKKGNLNSAVFKNGITVLIDGAEKELEEKALQENRLDRLEAIRDFQLGLIEISADRMVVWSDQDLSGINDQRSLNLKDHQMELYLEGDIVFRQGNQKVYASKMYFDVSRRRGYIREAEVFASFPNDEGLLRLRAEEIRMPAEGTMLASDTFVTTSRIGEPLYRFHVGSLLFRSQDRVRLDPLTGEAMRDPKTGEFLTEHHSELVGRRTKVMVGQVPVFYFPKFTVPMDMPSQIVNRFSLRSGSIFGVQAIVGFDMYRLLGMEEPWSGTSWDLDALWYTKRGPGLGTEFQYDRTGDGQEIPLGLFSGKGKGEFDFWGIYDTGEDNLGEGRRHLEPETKFRYQLFGRHQSTFGNDWDLKFQLGVLSDRNFQEEYFQHSWYEDSDRANQLKIGKTVENRSFSLWADVRTNDFHTQTQRLPQLEFYWLGEPLFGDLLTWNSYSQVGYVHLFPDTAPEDPADRALWHLLDWETERKGIRASTRHEISYPFQLGAVKVVPFVLGEAAYWGEDLNGDDAGRLYGQVGVRANLPMWRYYDFHSRLFNVNGVMHKVDFDVEALVAGSNLGVEELPLYDLPSDRALMDFAHHMSSTLFNGLPIPEKYQLRSYAVRSNLGGWVTSNTELADDLALIRFGMHHRWQTKRGMTGQERIVDWVTFDTNFNLYPNADRDNFGSVIGLLDYDLRWHPGDRLTVYSSGMFDFFSDGLCMVDVGMVLGRPGKGSFFTSLHYLTGSVENVVMRIGFNYRMSEKWAAAFMSSFDISGKGNIGESVSLTRIGESFLFTAGVNYDDPSDNFSLHFTLEPRFGKKGRVARSLDIVPPGVYGVD